jgi:hypothetical protein
MSSKKVIFFSNFNDIFVTQKFLASNDGMEIDISGNEDTPLPQKKYFIGRDSVHVFAEYIIKHSLTKPDVYLLNMSDALLLKPVCSVGM